MEDKIDIIVRTAESRVGKLEEDNVKKIDYGSEGNFSKLYSFATKQDRLFLYFGSCCAIFTGLGLPSFVFLIGDVINAFNHNESKEDALNKIKTISIIFLCIGNSSYNYFKLIIYDFYSFLHNILI